MSEWAGFCFRRDAPFRRQRGIALKFSPPLYARADGLAEVVIREVKSQYSRPPEDYSPDRLADAMAALRLLPRSSSPSLS